MLTILVADWSGNHKYVGYRGVSMRNNPDVRDSILFAPRYLSKNFIRELQSLPADSNDIPVRIPAQVDIAVLFFWGTCILYG